MAAIRIKICGITTGEDALAAARAGADMVGLVFAVSPRRVTIDQAAVIVEALPHGIEAVGVFRDAPVAEVNDVVLQTGIHGVQLHGDESPEYTADVYGAWVMKRIHVSPDDSPETLREKVRAYDVDEYLLDPGAGDGQPFDWNQAAGLKPRVFLSGGLTPANVGEAIRIVRPAGVDVSTGVEAAPGRKDPAKIKAFCEAVRNAASDG